VPIKLIIHIGNILMVFVFMGVYFMMPSPQQEGTAMMMGVFGFLSVVSIILGFLFPMISRAQLNSQTKLIITDSFFVSVSIYGLVSQPLGLSLWFSFTLMGLGLVFLLINTLRALAHD
jgi:hypothetical protein